MIPHKHVVINMVNPDNQECEYCNHRRKEHLRNINYIKSAFKNDTITIVEAFNREIRGLKMLFEFRDVLL